MKQSRASVLLVSAQGVGFMFLDVACCDVRFSSAGACERFPWEVHSRALACVSLVCEGEKSSRWVSGVNGLTDLF